MTTQSFTIYASEYRKAVEWLEEILTGMELSQKEILLAELLMEENFFRLSKGLGGDSSFSARLDVRKRFGDVHLSLSAKGEQFNPIIEMNEITEDETDYYSIAILKANREKLSYSWKKGENIVSIRIHSSDSKNAVYTLTALVLGIVLGVVMKASLEGETLRWVGNTFFLPIETMFMNALLMVAAPMIFFCPLTIW